ncbi:hypothetical protein Dcar01_03104 [Deinococcus carri]|uniref:Tail assembly chaperone n=1 Tax=Deinococcus carri TaxID=1211323 RepID=A0ABP9WAI3_9DEIO
MTPTVKFGQQVSQRPDFEINDLRFASVPLSLAEERRLAEAGSAQDEEDLIGGLLETLAAILNPRARGEEVDADWLLQNLTPGDLEGIVEYLRGEAEPETASQS